MFGKKKKIEVEKVSGFHEALLAIKTFIQLQEWESAATAISDIEIKETAAFEELKEKISDTPKLLQEQQKIYDKNKKILEKVKQEYEVKKFKYENELERKKFQVRFESMKKEIQNLYLTGQNADALNLLNSFFEENKNQPQIVNYYTSEKKKILKNIERSKEKERSKIKENAELEALRLAGLSRKIQQEDFEKKQQEDSEKKYSGFFGKMKEKLSFHKKIKEKLERKKLIDEVKLLLDEQNKAKEEIASRKLENIHKGLIKELEKKNMIGYDLYGKILGSDSISGDSFGFSETKNKYTFYLGDATGHGVRAALIISVLSKTFQEHVDKEDIVHLTYNINNTLKESLQSKNFVTGLIFEIDKEYKNAFNVVGMGHEPMLIYRRKTHTVERVIAGGLAGGIRIIKNIEDIKPKTLEFLDGDIVLTYSDGVLEAKDSDRKIYGLEKLEQIFLQSCQLNTDIKKIYDDIIEDLKIYRGGTSFEDDTTVLIFRRNTEKDILNAKSEEIEKIRAKEGLSEKELKRLQGKTKEEIQEELNAIRREKQLVNIVLNLQSLYMTGEFLKLKEEATRYIKDGFIDKKINFYLKKAIENEETYKIKQKNTKLDAKYNVLVELLKKKDFNTVIKECNEIIAKDGNI